MHVYIYTHIYTYTGYDYIQYCTQNCRLFLVFQYDRQHASSAALVAATANLHLQQWCGHIHTDTHRAVLQAKPKHLLLPSYRQIIVMFNLLRTAVKTTATRYFSTSYTMQAPTVAVVRLYKG